MDAQFERWFAAQTNLQSWAADFTQTRSLKVLAQPLVSTGKVWVAPSRFRWELGQPAQTIALRQPDQMFIIYPRLKREIPPQQRAARPDQGRLRVARRQPPSGSSFDGGPLSRAVGDGNQLHVAGDA
jgi:outer membrane lipoprotein-sorting protein